MVKYIFGNTTSCLVKFNTEEEIVNTIPYLHTNIDWMFEADEDGVLEDGTKVKKGDIIILFYKREWQKHRYVVVNNKQWKANRAAEKKYDEQRMKEPALKEKPLCDEKCCDCACESC